MERGKRPRLMSWKRKKRRRSTTCRRTCVYVKCMRACVYLCRCTSVCALCVLQVLCVPRTAPPAGRSIETWRSRRVIWSGPGRGGREQGCVFVCACVRNVCKCECVCNGCKCARVANHPNEVLEVGRIQHRRALCCICACDDLFACEYCACASNYRECV